MKVLLVSFSDNSDHQDTLFGLYEQLESIYDTYLIAISSPKVRLNVSDHTWLVDCPKRPGIEMKTFDIKTLCSLIYKIRKENFDVIYFESLHVWNLAIMMAAKNNTHTYHVIHEVVPHEGDRQVKCVNLMNIAICKVADTIVLRNKKYISLMIDNYRIEPNRVKYLELWRRYPNFTKPVHSGKVLFFGRMNPYKGVDNLLEIVRGCPNISFDIVGRVDSQVESTVVELSKEKNVSLNNGYVSDEEMKNAFIGCDWVIVPYNSASQSGVIIDAYKYSRPVIAFNVGAISEQIDEGKSGYLVKAKDNKMFIKKLQEVIQMDQQSYDKMCSQAYRYGSIKYAASGAVKRFRNLIESEI